MKCKYCGAEFTPKDPRKKLCNKCSAQYNQLYYLKHREKYLAYSRQNYLLYKQAREKLNAIQEMIT